MPKFPLKFRSDSARLRRRNEGIPQINASFSYAPFGEALEATNGGSTVAGTAAHKRRLNDKYEDDVSGLAYYGARYYDKTLIGWTQGDPLYRFAPDAAWVQPRRGNLYTANLNNSLRYIDPDGQEAEQVGQATTFVYNVASYALEVAEANASSASPLQKAAAVVAIGTFVAATVLGFASEATTSATTALMKPIDLGSWTPETSTSIKLPEVHGSSPIQSGSTTANQEAPPPEAASGGAASGGGGGWEGNGSKPTLDAHKAALKKVHNEVGGSLPLGKPGKFGSPQRGTSKKGYRLDPGHPDRPKGDPESGPHINWWDFTEGKRGNGGRSGAIPIE